MPPDQLLDPSLSVINRYVTALRQGDDDAMQRLRSQGYVLDWVHGDAFAHARPEAEQSRRFWPAWRAAFPEMDYEVMRTVAAERVVVTQWVFTGTQTCDLGVPVFDPPLQPTGRTIRLRGVSVYDLEAGLIQQETIYIDLATLWVELGVKP